MPFLPISSQVPPPATTAVNAVVSLRGGLGRALMQPSATLYLTFGTAGAHLFLSDSAKLGPEVSGPNIAMQVGAVFTDRVRSMSSPLSFTIQPIAASVLVESNQFVGGTVGFGGGLRFSASIDGRASQGGAHDGAEGASGLE